MNFEELEKEYYKSVEESNRIEIEKIEMKEQYDEIENKIEGEFKKFLNVVLRYKKYLCLNVQLKKRITSNFEIKNVIFEFEATYSNELKIGIKTENNSFYFDIHLNGNGNEKIYARYYNPTRTDRNYFNSLLIINQEEIFEHLNEYSNLLIKQYIDEKKNENLKLKEELETIYCFKNYEQNK